MSYQQYYAGFILDSVNKFLRTSDKYAAWKLLLESLSLFEVQFNFEPAQFIEESDSVIHIANNLLSRGIPTRPSVYLENRFAELLGLTIKKETKGSIAFDFRTQPDDDFRNLLLRSFCLIDPRISRPLAIQEILGSEFEQSVLTGLLPSIAGGLFISQLIEPQRPLKSLIKEDLRGFQSQSVDFSIEIPLYFDPQKFPGVDPRHRNLAIEVDGPHHADFNQRILDIIRDRAADCDTVRITQNDSISLAADKKALITSFLDRHYIRY
ncbi:hypothetical protein HXX01_00270 [Candidatus Nomurabacteria bacterium]|nr:hypothetical protein [Candidatus Nomurabacteria bacterium]